MDDQVSISSMFYEQVLLAQFPNTPKKGTKKTVSLFALLVSVCVNVA